MSKFQLTWKLLKLIIGISAIEFFKIVFFTARTHIAYGRQHSYEEEVIAFDPRKSYAHKYIYNTDQDIYYIETHISNN